MVQGADPKKKGRVYLVGAGPGALGLMTLRGLSLLREADVVVYDYLANALFLEETPPHCERLYVGKRGRGHRTPQEEICTLLVEKAKAGKCVVRLKGGDPFVFGRGGEEALALREAGILFEIVPGVSAGTGAAGYAGIPLTHRDASGAVTFVAGHEAPGKEGMQVNWHALAQGRHTLVIFMAVGEMAALCERLMAGGRDPKTPTALVRWGSTSEQAVIEAPLDEIAGRVMQLGIKPPALWVVGEVVGYRKYLEWFETMPLFGKKILVTRAYEEARDFIARLDALGAKVVLFPTIRIEKIEDPKLSERCVEESGRSDWILFTSGNTVDLFFEKLLSLGRDSRAVAHAKIGAVGPKTAERLRSYGIHADCVPLKSRAMALLEALKPLELKAKRVLIPGAQEMNPALPQGLRDLGAQVTIISLYRTVCPDSDFSLLSGFLDWVTFTSGSTARNFVDRLGPERLLALLQAGMKIAAIGPETQAVVSSLGLPCHVVAKTASSEGMIQGMIDWGKKA